MKVVRFPNKIDHKKRNLILGSFASFHNGHLTLLNEAKKLKYKIAILLFENPSSLPSIRKKEFETLDVRLQKLANIGFEEAIVINFNSKIQNISGKEFAKQLKEKYNVNKFIVGHDFKMGKNAKYNSKNLSQDFDTLIVKTKKIKKNKISTEILIEAIEFGDVELIKLLTPFYFTINVFLNARKEFKIKNLKPHTGIYSAWFIVKEIKYWSVVLIGKEKNKLIAPELLIKNKPFKAKIEFVKKIRIITQKKDEIIKEKDLKKALLLF